MKSINPMKSITRKIRRWGLLLILGLIILAAAGCTGFNDPDPNTTPTQPTSVSVTNTTATSATLNWEPPAATGRSPITKYQVRCNNDDWLDLSNEARSFTFSELTHDTEYCLAVRAVNANGNGSASVRYIATTN